ncbi:hypothetical protein [Actinokineospora sp. HUAS TT18]|uniref:hypothetical protein n=1 Tax=Actinokineospora sp. HUAS TT18 TaxID=3447451 RepID=UPI003F5280AC
MLPTVVGGVGINTSHERARAARQVAAHARDAVDCADLLAMLGLTADDGLISEDGHGDPV